MREDLFNVLGRWCAENALVRGKYVGARKFDTLVSRKETLVSMVNRRCAESAMVRGKL